MNTRKTPAAETPPDAVPADRRWLHVPREALGADPGFWEAARLRRVATSSDVSVPPRRRAGEDRFTRQAAALERLAKTLVASLFSLLTPSRPSRGVDSRGGR